MKEELLQKEAHAIPEKCTGQKDLLGQFFITITSPGSKIRHFKMLIDCTVTSSCLFAI